MFMDNDYSEFLLYFLREESGYAIMVMRLIRSISYTFHLQGVICQITLLYYFISDQLKLGFSELNCRLKHCSMENILCPVKNYRDLALHHSMLCDLVIEIDSLFSPVVFVCFSQVLVSISVQVNGIVIGEEMYSGKTGLFNLFTDLCFSISVIFTICYSGFTVMETAAEAVPSTLSIHKAMPIPDAIFNELQIILFRQISYPVSLTAGRFFTLSRDVLLTLGSAIVTYIIILMEIDH
ncbi:gustatory receptor family protein 3-like [Centruroides sculpturatus]|uniref:gustatory receptor family protein 3-like n=1 Tax=Centruroides sculpturatus TaxID=218467 RepID=UPI000C6D9C2C|nr:gustatory receptor family protein 3-like [Centruroides sculpturatus]